MSRSWSAIFSITPFDGKCQNLQICPTHFCASSYHSRDINIKRISPPKVGKGHRVRFSHLHHSMANVEIYQCHFFTFVIFAKVWLMWTILIDRHKHTETDKPMAIGEILQICLKNNLKFTQKIKTLCSCPCLHFVVFKYTVYF